MHSKEGGGSRAAVDPPGVTVGALEELDDGRVLMCGTMARRSAMVSLCHVGVRSNDVCVVLWLLVCCKRAYLLACCCLVVVVLASCFLLSGLDNVDQQAERSIDRWWDLNDL